ncbi:MAG: tetratricopeptide repeat protein [Lachnospiraceae bacterium]|nr:tetratricopeptide repeat protein [Lachnospiraceae bacterium]
MTNDRGPIGPEDYDDPRCPLGSRGFGLDEPVSSIPQKRISEKLDAYMTDKDFAGAERHLLYWLEEAKAGLDRRGEFFLCNEMMGFYRKTGREAEGIAAAQRALDLLPVLGYEHSASGGTCLVNAGTVYANFSHHEKALELFSRAREIYEAVLSADDSRLGGLYNNMALSLTALGRYEEARARFAAAIDIMGKVRNGELEQAITWLNLADAAEAQLPPDEAEKEIDSCLEKAAGLLHTPTLPEDGYTIFVCEKCMPVFDRYGWFFEAGRLRERIEAFYAGRQKA